MLSVPPTTGTYDSLLNWYLTFGLGAAIIVITLLAIFMVRYRDRGQKEPMPEHKVEGWKIVLVTVLISVSVLSTAEYQTFASFSNIVIPTDASCVQQTTFPCVHIGVKAFQWGWNFTYPNGKYYLSTQGGALTVPSGRIVVLNLTSKDVFHTMGIDMLAQKEDAIPGKTNQMWFSIPSVNIGGSASVQSVHCNAAGTSCTYVDAIRCFELCGVGHAFMWGNITVVDQATWNAFIGGP